MKSTLTWTAEDVVRAVHAQCLHEQTWLARGISIDSRSTKAGDLFVALKGPTHDGHDHVADAIKAGAVAAIVSQQPAQITQQAPLIFVADTFKALQDLGRAGRTRAEASIIAVTGSVGKTGTKEMLRLMLAATGDTYANEGSLNNHWGVPLSLARLPQETRFGVFEVGMNHAGELGPLSKLVEPQVALITTIEAVHLEYFVDVDAIADAKAEIFTGMTPSSSAILNRDNTQFARLAAAAKQNGIKKILTFGRHAKADARLVSWTPHLSGSKVDAVIMDRSLSFYLAAPGEHLISNALGALLATIAAGADLDASGSALGHYKPPQGRGLIGTVDLPTGPLTLIDESYNASPVAVRSAIRVLGAMQPGAQGRRILVLGDMRELGDASGRLHAELATVITDAHIDMVFCCGEMMQELFSALATSLRGAHAPNSLELMPSVVKSLRAGDIVTVKGSLSMKMKIIVDEIRHMGQTQAARSSASV